MSDISEIAKENIDKGKLRIRVRGRSEGLPIAGAKIILSYRGNPSLPIEEVVTDDSGNSEELTLMAPPVEYSMEPGQGRPYSEYTLTVTADGYRPFTVTGVEIMPEELAIQAIELDTVDAPYDDRQNIIVPDNTLYGNYPSKIPEEEVKNVTDAGEIVLSRVVVPEYVVVHGGTPDDNTVPNYYVRYRDYIKNVASCEIYSTWPAAAIRANILAILSFTMNRVYTEFYRGKGKNFTITSSTAYDHAFSYGRTIYQSIATIVDELFENYLSRPNVTQPILTQYCDGSKVSCPGWMTQWGSKYLADQGYSAIEILRYYYGSNMYINVAEGIAGIPSSWPGYNLSVGATGAKVRQIQQQLARIAKAYPAIPTVVADGIYGRKTKEAVQKFQSVFGLSPTGIIDYKTWYEISAVYVGVTRIAELR